jgi:hypothetical protein
MDLDDHHQDQQHPAYLLIKNAEIDVKIHNNLRLSKHKQQPFISHS